MLLIYELMMSLEQLVLKLRSSHEEIRSRALENIADKLKYGVIDVNKFVDETDCCPILISLFSKKLESTDEVVSKSVFPNVEKVIGILKIILEKSVNGRKVLLSLNAREIVFQWQTNYASFQTFASKEPLEEILQLLQVDNESSESQLISTYGTSLKSSVNESQDPCEFLDQRNLSLPPRLLVGSNEKRNYSPVTRSYIKRVTFSNDSPDQGQSP